MEYNTLIDTGRDGLHCILFSNRDVLDQEEIEKIFSRYGDVANIKFHGDNKKGICFVRYQDKDDAIRAVESLRGDSQITLLEHNKKKQKDNGGFERRQGSDHGQQNYDGARFSHQFSRQHNQDNGRSGNSRNGDYKENSHYGNSNNSMSWGQQNANGNKKPNDMSWGQKNANGNQKQNDMPWGQKNANGNQKQNDMSWEQKNANGNQKQNDLPWGSNNANGNQKQSDQPWVPKSPNEYKKQNDLPCAQRSPNDYQKQNDTFQGPNSSHRYQESNDGLPDLVDPQRRAMAQIQNQSVEVPELVTANGRTLPTSSPIKKQIIIAQEVIVANIHSEFSAPYILHLFDKYEPLAVSNIMVEPKTGKRYCHVYFKSAEDSQQVETSFDKKLLKDQRLVVLQSNRLVESAYFK